MTREEIIGIILDEIEAISIYKKLLHVETDMTKKQKINEMLQQEEHHKTTLMQIYGIHEDEVYKDRIMEIKEEIVELLDELNKIV